MAETTNIAWTDATFNPWIGCTKVGPGCDHCYASVSTTARTLGVVWGAGQPRRRTSENYWKQPLHWNARADSFRECGGCGWRGDLAFRAEPVALACPSCDRTDWKPARRRVFCASLADVFDNEVPEEWRVQLWGLIENTPNLDWLLLTKRIGNAAKMLPSCRWGKPYSANPYPNVWLGATIVNQKEADRDIPKLLATPAAKRFVSYEPALSAVDWTRITGMVRPETGGKDWMWSYDALRGQNMTCRVGSPVWAPAGFHNTPASRWPKNEGSRLDWIIVGGESAQPGYPARPFDIQWARDTVRQCREAGVPVFVKQLGSNPAPLLVEAGSVRERIWLKDRAGADPAEWPQNLRVMEFPT